MMSYKRLLKDQSHKGYGTYMDCGPTGRRDFSTRVACEGNDTTNQFELSAFSRMVCDQFNVLNRPGVLQHKSVGSTSQCPELAAAFGVDEVTVAMKMTVRSNHIAVGDVVAVDGSIIGMVFACISLRGALHIIVHELVVLSKLHRCAFNMKFSERKVPIDMNQCEHLRHPSCWTAEHEALLVVW